MTFVPLVTGAVETTAESDRLLNAADFLEAGLANLELPVDVPRAVSAGATGSVSAVWKKLGELNLTIPPARIVSVRGALSPQHPDASSRNRSRGSRHNRGGQAHFSDEAQPQASSTGRKMSQSPGCERLPSSQAIDDFLEAARSVGALHVVLDVGTVEDERRRHDCYNFLTDVGDRAAALGLAIALASTRGFTGDSREMRRTISEINHPAVRLEFDTGAYVANNPGSSGEIALERVAGELSCLRLRDHTGSGGDEGFRPLGEGGAVDFARTLEIVRGITLAGPCVVELPSPSRRAAMREKRRQQLHNSVAHLRLCGWFDGA